MHKQGDLVLVPFPFTDLSGHKVRPALVLNNKENGDDVSVCFISSTKPKKISSNEVLVAEGGKNFHNTGLKTTSLIKVTKIATLEKKVVLGKLGDLDKEGMSKVKTILKNHFGI